MTVTIGRREVIAALGGAAVVWPLATRAQQPGKLSRIGYLHAAIPGVLPVEQRAIAAFIMGLAERGLVQDRDFVIEYRYGDNRPDRLAEVAAELVDLKVDVLVTVGTLAPLALKRATSTIPIVLTSGGDPVGSGLVELGPAAMPLGSV
jgi:putative ABC transport system substrate-binding protein